MIEKSEISTDPADRKPGRLHVLSGIGLALALLAIFAAILSGFQHHHGWPLWRSVVIPAERLRDGESGAWGFTVPRELDQSHRRSEYRATLFEDGRRLGPEARSLSQIQREGGGRYLVADSNRIWFSTTDGSDPRTNGRRYLAHLPVNLGSKLPAGLAAVFGLGLLFWLCPLLQKQLPGGVAMAARRAQSLASGKRPLRFALWALLFGFCIFHFTRHNEFPYYYHPDEPKKAFFITETRAHFNHPQLLTTSTRLLAWMTGATDCPQMAVERGRTMSAVFASMVVVMLAAAGVRLAGPVAAMVAVPLLLLNPALYEAARYMKEDTALLAGIAATVLASVLFVEKPGPGRALFLGLAAGLAVSGKYIGVLILPLVMLLVTSLSTEMIRPWTRSRLFLRALAGMACIFTIINFDAIRQFPEWLSDFGREMDTFGTTKREGTLEIPHLHFKKMLGASMPPLLLVLASAQMLAILKAERMERRHWLVPMFFLIAYLGTLCFSIYPYERYTLPAEILLVWLASCGAGSLAGAGFLSRLHKSRPLARHALGTALAILVLIPPMGRYLPQAKHINDCLRNDTRGELYRFIRDHLPKDAVIAQHGSIRLPFQSKHLPSRLEPLPQIVLSKIQLAEFGSIADLRAAGVTHVAFQPMAWPESWHDTQEKRGNRHRDVLPGETIGSLIWRSRGPFGSMVATDVVLLELSPASIPDS